MEATIEAIAPAAVGAVSAIDQYLAGAPDRDFDVELGAGPQSEESHHARLLKADIEVLRNVFSAAANGVAANHADPAMGDWTARDTEAYVRAVLDGTKGLLRRLAGEVARRTASGVAAHVQSAISRWAAPPAS